MRAFLISFLCHPVRYRGIMPLGVGRCAYGLKAQKHIAQSNALGKCVTRCTPCRGKSKHNAMTVKCFFPYRAQLPKRIPASGCCPGLRAFGLSARRGAVSPQTEKDRIGYPWLTNFLWKCGEVRIRKPNLVQRSIQMVSNKCL